MKSARYPAAWDVQRSGSCSPSLQVTLSDSAAYPPHLNKHPGQGTMLASDRILRFVGIGLCGCMVSFQKLLIEEISLKRALEPWGTLRPRFCRCPAEASALADLQQGTHYCRCQGQPCANSFPSMHWSRIWTRYPRAQPLSSRV